MENQLINKESIDISNINVSMRDSAVIPNHLLKLPIEALIDNWLKPYKSKNTIRNYRATTIHALNYVGIYFLGDLMGFELHSLNGELITYLDSFEVYEETEEFYNECSEYGLLPMRDSKAGKLDFKKQLAIIKSTSKGFIEFMDTCKVAGVTLPGGGLVNGATIDAKAYALTSFFNYLIEIHDAQKNPLATYRKRCDRDESNTQSLDHGELSLLLMHLKGKYLEESEKITGGYTTYARDKDRKLLLDDYGNKIPLPYTYPHFRNYILVLLMALMSYRVNEAATLRAENINYSEQNIKAFRKGGALVKNSGPSHLFPLLNEYCSKLGVKQGYIFFGSRGKQAKKTKHMTSQSISTMIQKACNEVNIDKKITPHSLRSTFITISLEMQKEYIRIANSTNHKNLQMIKYYDNREKLKNSAALDMDSFIK